MKKNIHIIVNQNAYLDDNLVAAVEMIRKQGHKVEVNAIWQPRDIFRLTREAIKKEANIIVAAGGDGTVNAVVNEFIIQKPQNCAVSTLPYGTANDFALSNGFAMGVPVELLQMIVDTPPVLIDVVHCKNQVFINSCTGGYGAHVTNEASKELKSFLGKFAYFVKGITELADLKGHHSVIRGDSINWQGDLISVAIGNGRQAGGGMIISYNGLLNDGVFEGKILPDFQFSDIIQFSQILIDDKDIDSEYIIEFQSSWLEIETDDKIQFNLDGEPIEGNLFELKVLPQQIPFILPTTSRLLKLQEKAA